ncbi:MAG: GNAT family N-acetyltransferase [Nocardioidaceae bacterium]|nr:GNAT family N-acetyltransferase [Nocardioidaceae bacterium]
MQPYADHWEADVVLRDGRAAQLRPISPDDVPAFVDFYSRVSDQSKYYRFFAPYPVLSERDLVRFTQVDHDRRVAFVVTIGSSVIAVGRYDAIDDDEAEVAFLVEDAHQGRGLGQLLLEHLAQAGRERGLKRFVAEVLPDNVRMIQVFRDQGYKVAGAVEDGVMRLVFPINSTDTAMGVMQAREHRAEAASIERFFNARSVAVVGASRRQDTIGQAMVRNLVLGDYSGSVYAVNPHAESVSGLPAYTSVQEIPGEVDLAIVAVPSESVPEVVLDCAAKGVHGMVVISSGFAETGEEGRRRQRRLLGLARSYGLRIVGPNCLGVINTASGMRLNASLSPLMPARGRVGFFCQSGALGVAILETVDRRGLGLSTFVSAGNRADVSGNDLLQYWEEDDATEVVLLYLESIGNPRKFSRIARRVGRRKPVVAVKSGRSTQGVPVGHAVRHTTAPQSAVDAMFRQAGVIQVDTLDEMFDVAQLLAHQPLPRGPRIAVVDNSDALGLLVADAAAAAGLVVTRPMSLGANADAEDFERALDESLDHPDVDAVVAVFIPPLDVTGEEVANVLAAVGEQSDKPIVSTFLGTNGVPELLRVPDVEGSAGRGSVPSYSAPEAAVRALARVVGYAEWAGRPQGEVRHFEDMDPPRARALVQSVLAESPAGATLTPQQVHDLLESYGIDLWSWTAVTSVDEALAAGEQLGWDVVLKATAEHLRARPDLAHVWRNIDGPNDMRAAWDSLSRTVAEPEVARFIVQKMSPPGVPLSLRAVEDPLFGPLVSFGLAGAASELLGDRSYRIPPLTDVDASSMVRELRSAPLLLGYRGSEPTDAAAIEDLLERLAALKDDLPEVSELDLEPVLAHAQGLTVLTARATVTPSSDNRSDWYVRRLSKPAGLGDTLSG